ncbi:MAG: undecaprenyl-diphosphate phosphatase [Rikenellaceae bacterium]
MEIWEAAFLGAIQGLTEFLPVSSSGHLELASFFLGIQEPSNLQFTMAVHGATVLSTLVVFWGEIMQILKGVFRFKLNDETVFAVNILVSLVPILFVGLFFKDAIEGLFTSNIRLVGVMLCVTAVLLLFVNGRNKGVRKITPKSAFIMGIAQAFAVLPGISRSGATISTGLMMGLEPKATAKFSFLMVLVPIIGMNILELFKMEQAGASVGSVNLIVASLTAFITGVLACKWMIKLVQKGNFFYFGVYCLIMGMIAIVLS